MTTLQAPERASLPVPTELPSRIGINAIFLEPGMGGLDTYVRELRPGTPTPRARCRPSASFCSPKWARVSADDDAWADEVEFVVTPLFGAAGLKAFTELTILGCAREPARRLDPQRCA